MREGMHLSNIQFWFLALWFVVLAGLGGWAWAKVVLVQELPATMTYFRIAQVAVASAISVSSVFYIRKLYKDKFAIELREDSSKNSTAATMLYFLTRPLFAVVASVFFVFTLCGVVASAAANFSGFSGSFFIHISASAALVSVLTGNSITRLEKLAA